MPGELSFIIKFRSELTAEKIFRLLEFNLAVILKKCVKPDTLSMRINDPVTLADKKENCPEMISQNEKNFQNTLDIAAAIR